MFPTIGRFLIIEETSIVFQTPSLMEVLPHADKNNWNHSHRMHTSAPDETDFLAIGVHLSCTEAYPALFLINTMGASYLHGSKLRLARRPKFLAAFNGSAA